MIANALCNADQVYLHPSSLLFKANSLNNKYLIYNKLVQTKKIYVRSASINLSFSLSLSLSLALSLSSSYVSAMPGADCVGTHVLTRTL